MTMVYGAYGHGLYGKGVYGEGQITQTAAFMKMILQGGPLDGEQQMVQALNTQIGSIIFFSMPHYQTFASGGGTVIDLGMEVEYQLVSQGPPPGTGDTWTTSWIFNFVPESYTAPPANITPPVTPPVVATSFVSLSAESFVTTDGTASTGVYLTGETDLDVDGDTSVIWTDSTVTMMAGTALSTDSDDLEYLPPLVATASLTGDGINTPRLVPPVTGYTAWYDASTITGVADGALLSSWSDSSGYGVNLTQGSSAAQPTFRSRSPNTINGYPVVLFAGSQVMTNPSFVQAQPLTVILIATNSGSAFGRCPWNSNNGGTYQFVRFNTDGHWAVLAGGTVWETTVLFPYTANQPHFTALVLSGATSTLQEDGGASQTGNPGTQGLTGALQVGSNTGLANAWFGAICELLIYPIALSPAQIASLQSYAQQKWGTP